MNLSRSLSCLAAMLCITVLPSCNSGGSPTSPSNPIDPTKPAAVVEKKTRVAVVTNNAEEFWTICEAGANKAAQDFGVELLFRKPLKGNVTEQMDHVNALVRQNIAGIAVSVINPRDQAADLKLIGNKVKLITMDNDADGTDRICYIGTDNYAAGKAAGRLVKEVMPEGGDIAIFVGSMDALNAQQRFQGVVDELAGQKDAQGPEYGKYTLARGKAITDGPNRTVCQTEAKAVLSKLHSKKNICLIGLWAYNAPAMLEAVRSDEKYKHAKIVGFDEDSMTLNGIESGEIHGTIVQDPFNFGYKSVEVIAAEAKGDTSKRVKEAIPYRVVTKDGHVPAGEANKGEVATKFAKELKERLDSVRK